MSNNIPDDVKKSMAENGLDEDFSDAMFEKMLGLQDEATPEKDDTTAEDTVEDGVEDPVEEITEEGVEEGQSEESEDADEVEEPVKLTPKSKIPEQRPEIEDLKKEIEALKAQISKPETQKNSEPQNVNDEVKKLRNEMFISGIEQEVNSWNLTHKFSEIVESEQFDTYLNGKILGGMSTRGVFQQAWISRDKETMNFLFKNFADKNLTPVKKVASKVSKPSPTQFSEKAQAEVMPSTSKVAKPASKKAPGFDFTDKDYADNLKAYERGNISKGTYISFLEKFEKAQEDGRVKYLS